MQIGRSAGFNVGVSYAPHRQQTQQPQGSSIISTSSAAGSFSGSNSLDLLQMHSAADVFQVFLGHFHFLHPPMASYIWMKANARNAKGSSNMLYLMNKGT